MNALKKNKIKTAMKYTWPFYLISAILIVLGLYFIFRLIHKVPDYKTLTLFISGEVKDEKKLRDDLLEKFNDKDLRTVSCISANPNDGSYYTKLSVAGYNSADVLIIPTSTLDNLNVSAFALEINEEMVNNYYQGMSFYREKDINYGIKIDKEKVRDYMSLVNEDCYLFLNGKSVNTGKYSKKAIVEHDNALQIVKEWGM